MAVRESLDNPEIEGCLMLMSLMRPGYGIVEGAVAEAITTIAGGHVFKDESDRPLAVVVSIGESETYYSCHLDSVHSKDGTQTALYDQEMGLVYKEDGLPLGADDAAGIWLMLQMVGEGVPGVYGFHFSEERGGVGSSTLARLYPDFLKRFKHAIAFDRRGTTSVITYQGMGKCCSNEFALALADQLNQGGLTLAPDDTGIYTDTAEFVDIIPECTNLSVGYDREHSGHETLDVNFLFSLRDALIDFLDPNALPVVRKPGDCGSQWGWGRYDYEPSSYLGPRDEYDLSAMRFKEVVQWVRQEDPELVAEFLMDLAERLAYDAPSYEMPAYEEDERLQVGLM